MENYASYEETKIKAFGEKDDNPLFTFNFVVSIGKEIIFIRSILDTTNGEEKEKLKYYIELIINSLNYMIYTANKGAVNALETSQILIKEFNLLDNGEHYED